MRFLNKRLLDITASMGGLLALSPVLLATAIAVKASSKGPVLFRQKRVGRGGEEFVLLKFRTMTHSRRAEEGGFEAGDHSRVTPLGALLRRTKLDELPQLWNVFKGEMSLVGPRPEVREWVQVHPERWERILSVKPGITDNASVVFRNEEEVLARSRDPVALYRDQILPRKLELYEEYVKNMSLRRDLHILWHTARSLFSRDTP